MTTDPVKTDPDILRRALNEAVVHMLSLTGIVEDTIENGGHLENTGPAERRIMKVEAFIKELTKHTAIVYDDTLTPNARSDGAEDREDLEEDNGEDLEDDGEEPPAPGLK
jgi:hypothetical protein